MRFSSWMSPRAIAPLVALFLAAPAVPARADLIDQYGEAFRIVPRPEAAPGSFGVAVDALPDGRLILATGDEVLLETSVGAGDYLTAAIIDASVLADPLDPGFLLASPSGDRIALGAGFAKPILIFDTSLLNTDQPAILTTANTAVFNVNHFAGAWLDETSLAISAGDFGQPSFVSLLDVAGDPASPTNPIIIDNIDGASAGVGVDDSGAIYTGNGFDFSPGAPGTSETGWIKRFSPSEWMSGADFESDGLLIADILSAGVLRFDRDGALIVGGGDFDAGDTGALAVIHADALDMAIQSGVAVDANDPAQVKRLDPLGDGSGFYGAIFNSATDEILITEAAGWFATSGRIVGDLNGDGAVNGADLASLLAAFGTDFVFADFDQNGVVDGADIAALLANWGTEATR